MADPDTEQIVNDKVDAFWKGIEGDANKRGQVSLAFDFLPFIYVLIFYQIIITMSEKKPKKTWFYTGEEDVPWEQWSVYILSPPESVLILLIG